MKIPEIRVVVRTLTDVLNDVHDRIQKHGIQDDEQKQKLISEALDAEVAALRLQVALTYHEGTRTRLRNLGAFIPNLPPPQYP